MHLARLVRQFVEISRHLGGHFIIHFNESELEAAKPSSGIKQAVSITQTFKVVQADFSKSDGAKVLAEQIAEVHAVVVANGQPMYKLLSETTTADMDALWKVHVQNPAHFIGLISSQLRT